MPEGTRPGGGQGGGPGGAEGMDPELMATMQARQARRRRIAGSKPDDQASD